jgi:SAM-dependent methyltransferase
MNKSLLGLLVCPKCKSALTFKSDESRESDNFETGTLECLNCDSSYPVSDGIPRFVERDNYASSFGYQWNLFRKEQIDSHNGTTISADRFWSETGWSADEMKGKWVLDAGCGAGRFLDAASMTEAQIVGIDISSAVDAAKANLEGRDNVHFIQASIYELPFRDGAFDRAYCIGVIQHTPDPTESLRAVASKVKPGGKAAFTIYPRKFYTKLYSKYWLRPVTKRMSKERLLKVIERAMPVAFPVTDVLFRIPVIGKVFMFAIPVANYVHETQLSREQRYAWAILDTFDMLSPHYDQPMTKLEADNALATAGLKATRTGERGLNLVGVKQ